MVAYHYAREQAEKTRVQLAAFASVCHSSGIQALRRRQIAAFCLREFAQAATEAFAPQKDIPALRPRPDYLRLVEPEEEGTHVERGMES